MAALAFIGFEGIVNIAEEVRDPKRTLPRAIFLTLALTTMLYLAVAWVAVVAVPSADLAVSPAPLALVFERLTGASPRTMSLIAMIATLNRIILQIILSSRVLCGLACQGALPAWFREVSAVTRTPLNTTVLTAAAALFLALLFPLERLADLTSRITLVLFALVNLALVRKLREREVPGNTYLHRVRVPWAGAISCLALLAIDVLLLLMAWTS